MNVLDFFGVGLCPHLIMRRCFCQELLDVPRFLTTEADFPCFEIEQLKKYGTEFFYNVGLLAIKFTICAVALIH